MFDHEVFWLIQFSLIKTVTCRIDITCRKSFWTVPTTNANDTNLEKTWWFIWNNMWFKNTELFDLQSQASGPVLIGSWVKSVYSGLLLYLYFITDTSALAVSATYAVRHGRRCPKGECMLWPRQLWACPPGRPVSGINKGLYCHQSTLYL